MEITPEQLIEQAAEAARGGGAQAEQLKQFLSALASAQGAPQELRALARALLQFLSGEQPSLEGLPPEWAERLGRALTP